MRIVPLAAGFTLLLSLLPSPSEACTPAPCIEPARTAPKEGAQVPANAPAVAMFPLGFSEYDGGLSLLASDGGVVPADIDRVGRTLLLRPTSALVPGDTYRIEFGPSCEFPYEPVDAGTRFEVAFTAAPDSPLPADPGLVEVVQTGEEELFFDSCGGAAGHLAFARFALRPSEQMRPWLPVTSWVLRVDGTVWATLGAGLLKADGGVTSTDFFSTRSVTRVFAQCPGSKSGPDTGLRPGTHNARLEARVLGTDQVLVAAMGVPFTLTCTVDGGTAPGDGTTPLQPDLSGDGAPGCGCGSTAGALPGLVALALLIARARRGRATPGSGAAAGS